MKICYFGIYQKDYCRNKNIILGLRKNGIEVIEIQDRTAGLIKFWHLFKKHWSVRKDYDLMIVGFPGQLIVPFAKIICRKPIVFDAHVSLYDAGVFERKLHRPYSIKGRWLYFLDWLSCHLADRILLDTKEHVRYFIKMFGLKRGKFIVVYHGCDDDLFYPVSVNKEIDNFLMEFHGYITDLHGIEYVLEAMNKLRREDIELWVFAALERPDAKEKINLAKSLKLNNVKFFNVLSPNELIYKIAQADLGLGILGKTAKVNRVIPNKLYELMAMKKTVLTADTIAVKEQFTHKKNIYLCKAADTQSIANAILELKNNRQLRKDIAKNGYNYTKKNLVPEILGEKLIPFLKDYE